MANKKSSGGISSGYFVALGLAFVFLIASPGGREQLSKIIKFPAFGTSSQPAQRATRRAARGIEDMAAVRRDVEAFNAWLQNEAEVAKIRIDRGSEAPIIPRNPLSEERGVWRVPVSGVAFRDGQLEVLLQQHRLRVGDSIAATETRCGYQLISVTRRSIWFAAFDQEPHASLEGLRLGDIQSIHLSMDASAAPTEVELRPGVTAAAGDTVLFENSGARMQVLYLWRNAVHFRYEDAGQSGMLDLLCVILR